MSLWRRIPLEVVFDCFDAVDDRAAASYSDESHVGAEVIFYCLEGGFPLCGLDDLNVDVGGLDDGGHAGSICSCGHCLMEE